MNTENLKKQYNEKQLEKTKFYEYVKSHIETTLKTGYSYGHYYVNINNVISF